MDKKRTREYARNVWKEFLSDSKKQTSLFFHLTKKISEIPSHVKIFAYLPLTDEFNLLPVINELKNPIFIPLILGPHEMTFVRFRDQGKILCDLKEGPHGILQPSGVVPEKLILTDEDWVIVPSLGSSMNGVRLGRGGGYYDRWKDHCISSSKISILPEKLSKLNFPEETHDLVLNCVITENGLVDYIQKD